MVFFSFIVSLFPVVLGTLHLPCHRTAVEGFQNNNPGRGNRPYPSRRNGQRPVITSKNRYGKDWNSGNGIAYIFLDGEGLGLKGWIEYEGMGVNCLRKKSRHVE